jgi:hypothetical protein
VAVFHAGEIATEQAGAPLDVALGQSALAPVAPDDVADVDLWFLFWHQLGPLTPKTARILRSRHSLRKRILARENRRRKHGSAQVDRQKFSLGHFLDGVADSFAARGGADAPVAWVISASSCANTFVPFYRSTSK